MSVEFNVVARPGEGIVLMDSHSFGEVFTGQLWARCKAKKHNTCDFSGRVYDPGAMVYRPVGNSRNRYRRILATFVDGVAVGAAP